MKTVCIYHRVDLDGWMSAAIVKHWFITNNKESIIANEPIGHTNIIEFRNTNGSNCNSLEFIGFHYGDPIPDLSEYDRVIMCDVSFPKEEMDKLYHIKDFLWLDHHISAINNNNTHIKGIRDTKYAACELIWNYLFNAASMPEIVRLLGRYDSFGHKGTDEEQYVLEFQYGARQAINNYKTAYDFLNYCLEDYNDGKHDVIKDIHTNGKAIYEYLCTEAKSDIRHGFPVTIHLKVDRTGQIDGYGGTKMTQLIDIKFLALNKSRFNPSNFGFNHTELGYNGFACFWYDGKGVWNWSLYSTTVDCSVIAKALGGGGHKGAAGFQQDTLNFNFGLDIK